MQKLDKVVDSDIQEHELLLAKYLIHYHRHAFDVRSQDILNVQVDPPEVRELVNLLLWLGHGFNIVDRTEQVLGLHSVVTNSADEMKELISFIREHGALDHVVKEINFLNDQMEAADTLMGYLNG